MIPIGYSDYSIGQSGGQSGSKAGILLLILCIAAAVFVFMKLESPPDSVKAAELELEIIQAEAREREAQRQALKQQIQAKLSLSQGKLDALEQQRQAIDSEFLSLCQVPLEQAHATMSRKTARRVLQSPAFSAAFNRLLNTRFPRASFARQRDTIWQVAGNVSIDSLADSYIAMLDDVLIWIQHKQQVLQTQQTILDQLRQSSL